MQTPQTFEFNQLPVGVRAHLVEMTHKRALPTPLFSTTTGAGGCGWFLLLCVGLGICAFNFAAYNFPADIDFSYVVAPFAIYFLGSFVALFAISMWLRARARNQAHPFVRGEYLLPRDYVDLRTGTVKTYPVGSVHPELTHYFRNGVYQHLRVDYALAPGFVRTFYVSGTNKAQTSDLFRQRMAVYDELAAAYQAQDAQKLRALDPFYELRVGGAQWGSPPSAPGPEIKPEPMLWKLVPLFAAGVAFCFAAPTLVVLAYFLS